MKKNSGWFEGLPMRTVDGIGHPQNSCKNAEFLFLLLGEILIAAVKGRRRAFSVIACDQGDELPFPTGEAFPGMFTDQAGGFLVMGFFRCGRGPARVMQKRSGDEIFQVTFLEFMKGVKFFKKKDGPAGDMLDVGGLFFVFSHQEKCFPDEGGVGDHRIILFTGPEAIRWSQTP
jgi:hypothetical protein